MEPLSIAYCGLNCKLCGFLVACEQRDTVHLDQMPFRYTGFATTETILARVCEGCRGAYCLCTQCPKGIRDCITEKNARLPGDEQMLTCSACGQFPCERITAFANDGVPHHGEAVENLYRMKEIPLSAFLEEQEQRLRCHRCGKRFSWYVNECSYCN